MQGNHQRPGPRRCIDFRDIERIAAPGVQIPVFSDMDNAGFTSGELIRRVQRLSCTRFQKVSVHFRKGATQGIQGLERAAVFARSPKRGNISGLKIFFARKIFDGAEDEIAGA